MKCLCSLVLAQCLATCVNTSEIRPRRHREDGRQCLPCQSESPVTGGHAFFGHPGYHSMRQAFFCTVCEHCVTLQTDSI